MNKKSVSIIIPVYNTQDYIEECLDSISNQTYFENFDGYEILVGIDNCEKSLNKINEIRHKYRNISIFWFEENVGAYVVLNTLICKAKYDIFIRFDSDDIMQSYFVEKNIALVETDNYVIAKGSIFNHPNINNIIGTGNMDGIIIIYKHNFQKINGYKNWRCAADSDFNNRLNLSGIRCVCSNDITYLRRIHGTNLTVSPQYGHNSEYRSNIVKLINNVKEHDFVNENMVVCAAIKKYN